jgi:PIN domain nuclease of toxin-antitoxin system
VSETSAVIDASALLCLVLGEPGAARVTAALEAGGCWISAVNLSEVAAKLDEAGVPAQEIERLAPSLRLHVEPFDQAQAMACAFMRKSTRGLGLSLGDRACLQLALTRGTVALTADRAWSKAKLGVRVEVVR